MTRAEDRARAIDNRADELKAQGKPYVRTIPLKEARDWFGRYHYTGTIGNSQVGRFGYFDPALRDGQLLGIVAVGNATNVHGLSKRLELTEYVGNVEISRVAMHPWTQERQPCLKCGGSGTKSGAEGAPPGYCRTCGGVGTVPNLSTSAVIRGALDALGDPEFFLPAYEWVFSYADTGQGHHGGIYQALGASYVGRTKGIPLYTMNGERMHNRNAIERWGSNSFPHKVGTRCPGKSCPHKRCVGRLAAVADGVDLQKDWDGSSDKHTYILITAKSKRDRAALREHLKQFELPYPKRDGVGDVSLNKLASGNVDLAAASEENSSASSRASQGQQLGAAPTYSGPAPRLYPYQRVGAAFMAVAESALNGDDMGTGKTPQTIRALQLRALRDGRDAVFPALIACPNGVKNVWAKQFARWWPGVRVLIAPSGTTRATEAIEEIRDGYHDVLVINYEALPNLSRLAPFGTVRIARCNQCDPTSQLPPARCQHHQKVLNEIEWKTVVADEAHRIKDPKAQQTRAVWAIGDRARYRYGLTGTPPDGDELWSLMRFVSPTEYPTKSAWQSRYMMMMPNFYSGFLEPAGFKPETRAEFDSFFLPRFIRRPKEAVLPDLPPKTYVRYDVALTGSQERAYKQFRDSLVAQVDNGTLFATNPLQEVTRLKQLASAYMQAVVSDDGKIGYILTEEETYQKKDGTHARRSVPSAKLDALEKVLEDLGPKRQAVIFAEQVQLLKLLARRWEVVNAADAKAGRKASRSFTMLVGGMSDAARVASQETFESGQARFILSTFGAGGEGVDGLQVADVVIFLQRSWSLMQNVQAEARVHRAGQESDNVTVIDLITSDTVEDRVLATLKTKGDRMEEFVRDEETLRRWLA